MGERWGTFGTYCRELDRSRLRLIDDLQNGLRHRIVPHEAVPPGYVIDWHSRVSITTLDIDASTVKIEDPRPRQWSPNDAVVFIGPRRLTIGIEVLLPADVSPKPSLPKRRHAGGRPPDYPGEIIRQVARDYIKVYGLPRTQAMLREKVADECERNGFRVPAPTRFGQLVDPIHKACKRRAQREKSQSH